MRSALLAAVALAAGCNGLMGPVTWQVPDGPSGGGSSRDGGADPAEDPPSRPVDPDGEPSPEGGSVAPGGACECDGDCRGDSAHPGLCIHGVCGTLASASSCPPGSPSECPAGLRCWTMEGSGVCFPDFDADGCAGVADGYGSCVAADGQGCYAACGAMCALPGWPDGGADPADGDADADSDADADADPDADPDPDPPSDLTAAELDLLGALNDERASYGLPPVEVDPRLMCAARGHALDVGSTGACGHVGSDGSWPWDRAAACGFPQDSWTVNEIAAGPGFSDGADAVWGWRHSPGHHAAIVHASARTVGLGVHATCFIALFDCCVASG